MTVQNIRNRARSPENAEINTQTQTTKS